MSYNKFVNSSRVRLLNFVQEDCDKKNDITFVNGRDKVQSMKKYQEDIYYEKEVNLFEINNSDIFLNTLNSDKDSDDDSLFIFNKIDIKSKMRSKISMITINYSQITAKSGSLLNLINNIHFQGRRKKGFNTLNTIASKLKKKKGIELDIEEMRRIIQGHSTNSADRTLNRKYILPVVSPDSNSPQNSQNNITDRYSSASDFHIKLYKCDEFKNLSEKVINLISAYSSE